MAKKQPPALPITADSSSLARLQSVLDAMATWQRLAPQLLTLIERVQVFALNEDLLRRRKENDPLLQEDPQLVANERDDRPACEAAAADIEECRVAVETMKRERDAVATDAERAGVDPTAWLRFLNGLDPAFLPEARLVLDRIRVKEVAGTPEEGPDWSVPINPAKLRTIFGCSQGTLKKRLEAQNPRNKQMSLKQYMIALEDLPADVRDQYRAPRKRPG